MKHEPKMRVREIIRQGESRFFAQYRTWYGVWLDFFRDQIYRGVLLRVSSFRTKQGAQEFCEKVAAGDTIKIHPPFSEPDLAKLIPPPPPHEMIQDRKSGRMVKNPEYELYRAEYAVKREVT